MNSAQKKRIFYYLPAEYPVACSSRFRFGEAGGGNECGLQIINPAHRSYVFPDFINVKKMESYYKKTPVKIYELGGIIAKLQA
ncbi:MAG: hypothetical protein Q8O83_00325 [bacterium]|nr:hypothetical protein [bacterium]